MYTPPKGTAVPNTPPTASQMEQKAVRAKKQLEQCFKTFHSLMSDKVLDSNKTKGVKNTETKIVNDLLHAVVALEHAQVGQGLLSLMTISIREHLSVRDRVNELEYELYKTKRDLESLQRDLGVTSGKK